MRVIPALLLRLQRLTQFKLSLLNLLLEVTPQIFQLILELIKFPLFFRYFLLLFMLHLPFDFFHFLCDLYGQLFYGVVGEGDAAQFFHQLKFV